MLLNDDDIRKLCTVEPFHNGKPMISPFAQFWPYCEERLPPGTLSYGLTSAGYDIRLDPNDIKIYKNSFSQEVDPKRFKEEGYAEELFDTLPGNHRCGNCGVGKPEGCLGCKIRIPPKSYILCHSYEYFYIPRHLEARCMGKSSLARVGIIVNVTPLEPEWYGKLTVEIYNSNPSVGVLYAMEGIAQIQFERLTAPPLVSYADKGGAYQGQSTTTLPTTR